ncbi:3-hydroxyacyl-ACP dehydratase FabZ family protein [Vagococcus sp. WN89Y]|uniref:3-hydroxyacyl-ACP dehydratase FabZ family protein n=1 Tax=Vagococcus sp. WN89Y TaxID=3457258 RepID=UPI003FCE183D
MGGWRQPLIMVDRIEDYKYGDKGYVKVAKHISYNEPWLAGHFPDDPIMPGTLISEIFGQASEYLSFLTDICTLYHQRHDIELKSLRDISRRMHERAMMDIIQHQRINVRGVLAAQNLKFKGIVYPGDTVDVTSELTFSDPHGFKHYSVAAYVDKKQISHGSIINYREVKSSSKGMER